MPTSVRPTNVARVTMLMRTNLLNSSLNATMVDLLKAQDQLSSGLRLTRPSDSPGDATSIMHLDDTIERQTQYLKNMSYVNDFLTVSDSALGTAVDLATQAYSLAMESIGDGTDDAGREANAIILDSIIEQMVAAANSTSRDSYVFAGGNRTNKPYAQSAGGVMYYGTNSTVQTRVAVDSLLGFNINGSSAFGSGTGQILGTADLNPVVTADTMLSDLNGDLNEGIRLGAILITDGSGSTTVDLTSCVTLGDVINKINNECPASITCSINAAGNGLRLDTSAGTVTVNELGSGTTARDLGIYDPVGVGGATLTGQDVDARLSLSTPVTALDGGVGIDLVSGLLISNSLLDPINPIDLSGAQTVEDIINALNNGGAGVRAQINADGTGIDIINLLGGSELRVGENGGTTAQDLGIRSMTGATALSDLNGGDGIHTTDAVIQITDRQGVTYDVDLGAGAPQTVQDVIDLINAATGGAVVAGLATSGNGIVLTNTVGGAGDLKVDTISSNGYFVADELGLAQAVSSDTLTGDDINPIASGGVFDHLIALRNALRSNDNDAISAAAQLIDSDRQTLSNMHGKVGAQMRALDDRIMRTEDQMLASETLRSDLRDVDFTEAIMRYQNLQTALQANLTAGQQLANMSLLDFLR